MMKRKTQIIILIVLLLVISAEAYSYYRQSKYQKEEVPTPVDIRTIENTDSISEDLYADNISNDSENSGQDENRQKIDSIEQKQTLPSELNLKAVFYPQAPFANWDYPWQEACEEASVLLAANEYFEYNWTKEDFNEQILNLVEWENEHFGDYEHTSVDQTAKILEDYLGLEVIIHENPDLDDIKKVLAEGHFIIMTLAGKELGNPFFTNGGPVYHAVLVKGYKSDEKIIVHDVGTRNGEDYVYSWNIIDNALHDYAEPIDDGAKRMIEVLPPDGL